MRATREVGDGFDCATGSGGIEQLTFEGGLLIAVRTFGGDFDGGAGEDGCRVGEQEGADFVDWNRRVYAVCSVPPLIARLLHNQ